MDRNITRLRNGLQLDGRLSGTDTIYLADENGNALLKKDSDGNLAGLAKTTQVQAVTATVAGDTTGVIAPNADHVVVTSSVSTKKVTLPAPVVGKKMVVDVGANGFKLQTTAPATIGINGGVGASAVSAVAANSTIKLICVSLTSWKATFWDADSDVAKLPAAA